MTRFNKPAVFASAGAAQVQATLDTLVGTVEAFKLQSNNRIDAIERELKDANTRAALAATLGSEPSHVNADILAGVSAAERTQFLQMFNTMRTDSGPDGGYLVPRTVEAAIGRLASNATTLRQLARVVSLTSGDRYVKNFWQGRSEAKWVTERQARNQTVTPQLSETEIIAHELMAMPAVTQKLLDDARTDIASELAEDIALAFAEAENASFVRGSGVNQPRGFLTVDTVADASWSFGKLGFVKTGDSAGFISTSASASPADCLVQLIYKLKPAYRANARFIMNSNTVSVVRRWKDNEGNFLWVDGIAAGAAPTLLGYAVVVNEEMPDIGANEFPIAFGDWQRGYTIVDRIGIRVLRDPYSVKPYVLFYTTKRVGGAVMDWQAIKLLKIEA